MKFFDFCAGIGAGRLGLEKAGMTCVGYSEINRSAISSYNLLHNTYGEKNYGNLTKLKVEELPDFDLAIAGFPCQTFSVIGRQEGFNDDRGQIIFHLLDILKAKNVKYFIFENVKGLTTHDKGQTLKIILAEMDKAGYKVFHKVLTSMNYGVPQMRQRVYFVGIRKDLVLNDLEFEWKYSCKSKGLKDILISDNNEIASEDLKYFNEYLENKTNLKKIDYQTIIKQEYLVVDTRQSDLRLYYNRIPTLRSFRDGLYYVRGGKLRTLTGYEAMLIQGFLNDYADRVKDVKDRDLLRQTGNAMTVGVVESIGKSLNDYLNGFGNVKKSPINDAIVGVVKSKEQLDYCVDKNIYYTYKKSLTLPCDNIEAVALYQTKSGFGAKDAGIFMVGKVEKIYNVKRSQIHFNQNKNRLNESCIVFQVKEWISLKNPILPVGNAKTIIYTNKEKLKSAPTYVDLT